MIRYLLLCFGLSLYITSFAQLTTISADRLALVKQYLDAQNDFSGLIILGAEGEIKFTKNAGYADRKNKIPFTDQTLSTIGSVTKPFTATAILLLMEDGKLNPAEPISKYFEGVPNDKAAITLHQLLSHSSGLPGALGDDYEAINTMEYQKRVWQEPLLFNPGTGYEYSNVGFSLLGMIVEKISGLTYSAFLEERIFNPAGMKTAGYFNPEANYKNLTHGYKDDGSDWGTSHDKNWGDKEPYWHLKANGGLLMSARDMYQWYLALRGQKVLMPASLKLQTTPHVDEGGGSFYGYGYALDPEGECVQHNGGNRIFKADFRWFPKADIFFYSFTNDANVRLFRINDQIMRILETGQLPETDTWVEVPAGLFPQNIQQKNAESFVEMLKKYNTEKASEVLQTYFSEGIVSRNGKDRMYEIFNRLHQDAKHSYTPVYLTSGQKIQIQIPVSEGTAYLKIFLTFLEDKIDSLSAEIGGK